MLVSDRHDNIGMDRVARAIGDRAGATVVLDAGDDTSTGQPWEAFSLDSVSEAFDGYDRFAVTGNHDAGDFVGDYLDGLGLDGARRRGRRRARAAAPLDRRRRPALQRPRQLARRDRARASPRWASGSARRSATPTSGSPRCWCTTSTSRARPSSRGCADLVVGGHVHVRIGPDRVEGAERRGRLPLHDRHDRRRGVRHRDRQQAAPRRHGLAHHLPRGRPTGRRSSR